MLPILFIGMVAFQQKKDRVITGKITDEQGKIVHQEKRLGLLSGQQQWTINIRNFSKGTYVCSVISSKGIMSKNFIIAR